MYDVKKMADEVAAEVTQDSLNESFGLNTPKGGTEVAVLKCSKCGHFVNEAEKVDYCKMCGSKDTFIKEDAPEEEAPAVEKTPEEEAKEGKPEEEAPAEEAPKEEAPKEEVAPEEEAPVEGRLPDNANTDPNDPKYTEALLEGKFVVMDTATLQLKSVKGVPMAFESKEDAFKTFEGEDVRVFEVKNGLSMLVKEVAVKPAGDLPQTKATKSQKDAEKGDGEGGPKPHTKVDNAGKAPEAGTKGTGKTPGQAGTPLPDGKATKAQKSAEKVTDTGTLTKMAEQYLLVKHYQGKDLSEKKKAFVQRFSAKFFGLTETARKELKMIAKKLSAKK